MSSRVMSLEIKNFPHPPSVNRMYAYPQGRVVKSKEYAQYDKQIIKWRINNQDKMLYIQQFVKELGALVIHIDATFYMFREGIICKNGKPKRNDTSNRIKILHDVLSGLIGIDDCYFWSGSFSKTGIEKAEGSSEYVDLVLKLRTIDEVSQS